MAGEVFYQVPDSNERILIGKFSDGGTVDIYMSAGHRTTPVGLVKPDGSVWESSLAVPAARRVGLVKADGSLWKYDGKNYPTLAVGVVTSEGQVRRKRNATGEWEVVGEVAGSYNLIQMGGAALLLLF